jgi:hypothetical protein
MIRKMGPIRLVSILHVIICTVLMIKKGSINVKTCDVLASNAVTPRGRVNYRRWHAVPASLLVIIRYMIYNITNSIIHYSLYSVQPTPY